MGKKRNKRGRVKLVQIVRESISLAHENANFTDLHEIFHKKWLSGAKKLGCTIICYSEKAFLRDNHAAEEIPVFLHRQILNAFGRLSQYRAGYTFEVNGAELILVEMRISTKRNESDEKIAAAFFVPALEVDS